MVIDRVHVRVRPHVDIDFSSIYGNQSLIDYYYTSQEVCNKLRLSNLLLSRISSSCSCEQSGNGRYKIDSVFTILTSISSISIVFCCIQIDPVFPIVLCIITSMSIWFSISIVFSVFLNYFVISTVFQINKFVFLKWFCVFIIYFSRKEIGLCFKYSKRQLELPGYCKQYDNIWMYSKDALDILTAYVKRFPIMFQHLNAKPDENIFSENDLFSSDSGWDHMMSHDLTWFNLVWTSEKLSDVEAWLKALPTYGLQPIKCGSFSLDPLQVAAVERLVAQQQKNATKTLKLKVKPWTLFKVH